MHLVDTHAELERACRELTSAERLHLDTEFDSGRSGTEICVIQLSSGDKIFVIDPLRLKALEPLAEVLSSAREWVLHAGLQDVALLGKRFRLTDFPPIFDTQVAWALLGPEPAVSLAYLQYRVLGLRTSKPYQADDWRRRPLPPSQLAYAAGDVEHLPALREKLGERLSSLGREPIVYEAARELLVPRSEPRAPLTLESFRGAWQLDRHGQAALRFLVSWYESLSDSERASAPEPKLLVSIAARLPESASELARMKGIGRRFVEQHGDFLTGRVLRATSEADAADFVAIEPAPYATFRDIRLDAWLGELRAEICAELNVAPELALPARIVRKLREAFARGSLEAALGALEGWRTQLLGDAFRAYVAAKPPPV